MDKNRVKDPLGHYDSLRRAASPVEPMSGFGVFVRVVGLALLGLAAVGGVVYGLFF